MDSEVHMFAIMDWISQHYGFIERRCWLFAKILMLLTERTGTISPILVQSLNDTQKRCGLYGSTMLQIIITSSSIPFKLLIYLPKTQLHCGILPSP